MCSKRELLDADNKFHCSSCNSYQEAQKWVDIKTCPPVLIIHLNRLAFLHHLGREQKVKHRVVFGNTLTPPNMAEGSEDAQYRLYAVIVHMGTSAAHGAPSRSIGCRHVDVSLGAVCLARG